MTPVENSTLNCDPNPRSQFNLGSQFNVESRPGVKIQRGIKTRGHNSTWNHDPGHNITNNLDLCSNSTCNYDRGYNSTLSYDPGSQFNVELWPRVIVPHWIVIQIQRRIQTWGHNSTWNKDPGSQFKGGGGPNFIRRRGRNTMTPCLGGRNSTWKIRWILSTVRWIKTPRVEIQWGQNSILHRQSFRACTSTPSFLHCRLQYVWSASSTILRHLKWKKNWRFFLHILFRT